MAKSHNGIRWEQTIAEMKSVYADRFKRMEKAVEPKWQDASFCDNLDEDWHISSWTDFQLLGGAIPIKSFIEKSGLEKCKKAAATCLLIAGEKDETGLWLIGKHKNYWLRARREN